MFIPPQLRLDLCRPSRPESQPILPISAPRALTCVPSHTHHVRHTSCSVLNEGHSHKGTSASVTTDGSKLRGLRFASMTSCVGEKGAVPHRGVSKGS